MRNVNRFFADTCSAKSAWLCLPFFLFFLVRCWEDRSRLPYVVQLMDVIWYWEKFMRDDGFFR